MRSTARTYRAGSGRFPATFKSAGGKQVRWPGRVLAVFLELASLEVVEDGERMGEQVQRFQHALKAAHAAAGGPSLDALVRVALQQIPPGKVSKSAINDWLNGKAVPSTAHTRSFLAMARFLQNRAVQSDSRYTARPEQWWKSLLERARQEKNAAKGGRPRGGSDPIALPEGPVTLPAIPHVFTGRESELAQVMRWLEPGDGPAPHEATMVIAGMGGIGKTAIALHAAHEARARGWFPGGILVVDMQGYGHSSIEAGEVADRFLRVLGVKSRDLPNTIAQTLDAWHLTLNTLASQARPLLLVLDNVRTPAQIAGLLPGAPHRALITSRHTLSASSVNSVSLSPLSPRDAIDLLDQTVTAGGRNDERVSHQSADALQLVKLCGHLPLALRIIGAMLRDEQDRPLSALAAELQDERTRLDAMEYDSEELAVRASFQLSYQHLTAPQQRAFGLLSLAPGPDISTMMSEALLAHTTFETRRLLSSLARAHLLHCATVDTETLSISDRERWSMHDLVHLFACEISQTDGFNDQGDGLSRLFDRLLDTARAAATHLGENPEERLSEDFTGRRQALEWLENERPNLLAAAKAPSARNHAIATRLAFDLTKFFDWRRHFDDLIDLSNQATTISRTTGNRREEGNAINNLGIAFSKVRRFQESIGHFEKAIAIYREIGDRRNECRALGNLGGVLDYSGLFEDAIRAHIQSLAIYRELGDQHGAGTSHNNLGGALRQLSRFPEALNHHARALEIFRDLDDIHAQGMTLNNLAITLRAEGRLKEAIDAHTNAATFFHESADRYSEGTALSNLGLTLRDARQFEAAVHAHTRAVNIFHELSDRGSEGTELIKLGAALRDVNRFEEVTRTVVQAAEIFREIGDQNGEGHALTVAGIALGELLQFEEAIDAQTRAAEIFHELGNRHSEDQALALRLHMITKYLTQAVIDGLNQAADQIAAEPDNSPIDRTHGSP